MFPENKIAWYVGCSGFHYKEWKELFYPKGLAQNKWFGYYCEHFNTLELNVTFYRFPQLSFLQSWYQKSPPGFVFSVKAPRLITNLKIFNETESLLYDFYSTIRDGLQEKLGCVLFQFFSKTVYSEDFLSKVIGQLDPAFVNVLEFRHPSWWRPQVFERLANQGIVFSGISHPQLPDAVICNTDTAYYRFHGVPQLYYSPYPPEYLHHVADAIRENGSVRRAFLYFNNTAQGSAIMNAQYLLQQFLVG